jgi:hypothetical protein
LSVEAMVVFFAGICEWIPEKDTYSWAELIDYISDP